MHQLLCGQPACFHIHPHAPHHPAIVFPTLPWGCDPSHLYSKSSVSCGRRHGHMRVHETLCHLGLIFSPSITAAAEAFMCCGGQRRNAGQTALRAPTEGKLQGAPSHRDPGEKASRTLWCSWARPPGFDVF